MRQKQDVFKNEINESFRNQLEAIKIEVGDFFRICETISCKYDLLKARQATMKIRGLLKQFRQTLLKKEKTLSETTYERVEQIKKIFHNNE